MSRLIDSNHPVDRIEQQRIDKITRVRRVFNSINMITANSAFMGLSLYIDHSFGDETLERMERSMRKLADVMLQEAKSGKLDPSNRKVLASLSGSINHELDKRF